MTGCKDFQIIMQTMLDGTAAEKERADFEGHMTLCRDCAMEFKALQLSLDLLVAMPVSEPSPGFTSDTVKLAFKAKKDLMRRQRILSWGLSGLAAIISALIIAGWHMVFQPAIRMALLSILKILSEWKVLSTLLVKVLFSLVKVLAVLGDATFKAVWEGYSPICLGYMIVLIIVISFILITDVRSSVFSLKGGKA